MQNAYPSKVLVTGGHEIGGVGSFAEGLITGFSEIGIPVETIPPARILTRWRDLRDPKILKILSTTAVFAAPFARRAICLAHGVPRADYHGWLKMLSIIASYKIADHCSGAQLVSVSHYTASTLRATFNVRTDAVVHNPAKSIFLEPYSTSPLDRRYITYVGRLIRVKNLHRILPAVRELLEEFPELRMCIIGQGEQRAELEALTRDDPRFEFKGSPNDSEVRELLRQTKVFVSGNEIEGFGIVYLEAMAQGCNVVMPAGGGGLEIAPELIGHTVHLLPISWDVPRMVDALRRALQAQPIRISVAPFSPSAVAESYLRADANFLPNGRRSPARGMDYAIQGSNERCAPVAEECRK